MIVLLCSVPWLPLIESSDLKMQKILHGLCFFGGRYAKLCQAMPSLSVKQRIFNADLEMAKEQCESRPE